MLPCSILAGVVYNERLKVFTALHLSLNDLKSTVSIDLGVTNKFQQVDQFANMESANNND